MSAFTRNTSTASLPLSCIIRFYVQLGEAEQAGNATIDILAPYKVILANL